MAGLWESWMDKGEPLETFTIITTSPNGVVSPVHDRMPVILTPEESENWLEKGGLDLLRAIEDDFLVKACESKPNRGDDQIELGF